MSEDKVKKGEYSLRVPKNRLQKEFFEIELNDIDEPTYVMAKKLLEGGKEFDAVRLMVKQLWVSGNCDYDEFATNFIAVQSAGLALAEMITPLDGTLKKN